MRRGFLVGRPTLGLPVYFFANDRHVQWAIPQTRNEGSVFIQVWRSCFCFHLNKGSELRCYVQYAQTTYKHTDCSW